MSLRPARLPAAALAATTLFCLSASADDLRGYVQFRGGDNEIRDQRLGEAASRTDSSFLDREINFSFSRQAFPLFHFWGGGTFEENDTDRTMDGSDFTTDERRLRPYLGVGRRGKVWSTQLSWIRDERRITTNDRSTTVRDGWFGSLARVPRSDRMPRMRLSLSRNHDRQLERRVPDTVSDNADLDIGQTLGGRFRWDYRGTLSRREDRVTGSDSRTLAHNGNLTYNDEWHDRRVTLSSKYSINYRENRIQGSGSGEVDLPLFPIDGLVARDETPLDGALDPAPALLDDDLTTPTQIDLGLADPGDDTPWSLGLGFVVTTTLNTLFVYIDRELEPAVAATFSWQIYSSPNNDEWTLRQIVSAAPYDEFQRRFTIRLNELSLRYIKLVVRPLGPGVPQATEFPDLFVTELEAVQREASPSGRREESDTLQTLNVDTRVRLLAGRELYFLSNLNLTDGRGRRADYRWSNGLYYTHRFAPNASWITRVSWDETRDELGSESVLVYSSALQLRPVERLTYNLSLSGRNEEVADEIGGDQISLFLYATADLYRGVYVRFGARRSHTENILGNDVPSTQVDFAARIEPRRDIFLQLSYTDSVSGNSQGLLLPEIFSRAAEARLTYTPVSTVYFFGSYRLEWRNGQDRDSVRTTSVSWAPFPDATFRLGLNYNETRRELFDNSERVLGSTLRWNLNPRAYFELAYVDIRDERSMNRFDNENVSAILRWGF